MKFWHMLAWNAYELHAYADALAADAMVIDAAYWRGRAEQVVEYALRAKAKEEARA